MQTATLPPAIARYLDELAAQIVAEGGFNGRTPEQAMREAHEKRHAFAIEMACQTAERAKMAARVMCAQVYGQCVARGAMDKVLGQIEAEQHVDTVTQARKAMGL
jgi:hypothetical protein